VTTNGHSSFGDPSWSAAASKREWPAGIKPFTPACSETAQTRIRYRASPRRRQQAFAGVNDFALALLQWGPPPYPANLRMSTLQLVVMAVHSHLRRETAPTPSGGRLSFYVPTCIEGLPRAGEQMAVR
jgi:hypothetical protein